MRCQGEARTSSCSFAGMLLIRLFAWFPGETRWMGASSTPSRSRPQRLNPAVGGSRSGQWTRKDRVKAVVEVRRAHTSTLRWRIALETVARPR